MIRILEGDVREHLAELPDDTFDCVVTSPPYWGLRDYGTAKWEGGSADCDHLKGPLVSNKSGLRNDGREHVGPYEGEKAVTSGMPFRDVCGKCGARRIDNQIGLEPTLTEYLDTMVSVCRELRRVLKPSGTFWLNIGDSYAGSWGNQGRKESRGSQREINGPMMQAVHDGRYPSTASNTGSLAKFGGMKAKDLCMVPNRLAIRLQEDGWYVRSEIVWHKPNPMPESVTDRPTSSHEKIWLLTKSERYFYDADAIREDAKPESAERYAAGYRRFGKGQFEGSPIDTRTAKAIKPEQLDHLVGRNARNVWTIASQPYSEAHFATFPPELAERCIKAGSSEKGVCPHCGSPWLRHRIRDINAPKAERASDKVYAGVVYSSPQSAARGLTRNFGAGVWKPSGEWSPSCDCPDHEPIPAMVLDPFGGAGTTGMVADRLGRNATLIELNPDYVSLIKNRITEDAGMFAEFAEPACAT